MKKFSIYVFGLLAMTLFSSCSLFSGGSDVSELVFDRNDEPVAPSFYSEDELKVLPNYDDRTLALDFARVYPHRDSETLEEDFSGEGTVGGEFFDRFESILEMYEGRDIDEAIKKIDEAYEENNCEIGGGNLVLHFMEGEMEYTYDFKSCISPAKDLYEEIDSFYWDVVNLLMEEVPV